ncbi:MAG: DUF1499 domain-containing protein [Alphaproteobacteria bacterium]|nr:DUF1499 domain-containing protein [Alphaproteobacteria bacterium]
MSRLLVLLLGLVLPGCSGHGAEGLPAPPPMDFARLVRPATPNTALAAPAGFVPAPDIVTARRAVTPAALYAAVRRVAASQPRTYPQVAYADRLQAHYVARSAVFNFPDLIAVQVLPDSTLILFSRSVYGRSDFGVNRKRLGRWLAALDAELGRT